MYLHMKIIKFTLTYLKEITCQPFLEHTQQQKKIHKATHTQKKMK